MGILWSNHCPSATMGVEMCLVSLSPLMMPVLGRAHDLVTWGLRMSVSLGGVYSRCDVMEACFPQPLAGSAFHKQSCAFRLSMIRTEEHGSSSTRPGKW